MKTDFIPSNKEIDNAWHEVLDEHVPGKKARYALVRAFLDTSAKVSDGDVEHFWETSKDLYALVKHFITQPPKQRGLCSEWLVELTEAIGNLCETEHGYKHGRLDSHGCFQNAREALDMAGRLEHAERGKALLKAAAWTLLSYGRAT